MTRIKTIPRPEIEGARKLGPLDLNRYHFSDKRTVLTPARLEAMARRQGGKDVT